MTAARRSLWLSLADSYLMLVLQLVSTMIIARVLSPAEIGVFAIAAVFSSLASMFRFMHDRPESLGMEREFGSTSVSYSGMQTLDEWMAAHRAQMPAV